MRRALLFFAAVVVVMLASGCDPEDNLPGRSVDCQCVCRACTALDNSTFGCTGSESAKAVTGCATENTTEEETCDETCRDSEEDNVTFPTICFPTPCWPVQPIETCRNSRLADEQDGIDGDCLGHSVQPLIAPASTATDANIDAGASSATVVMGEDEGNFDLDGHIFFNGGFCGTPPCGVLFQGFEVRSTDDFFVGAAFVQDVLIRNNGEFSGEVQDNGDVSIVASGAFDISAVVDGIFVSRSGVPTRIDAVLDAAARELAVEGQVALSDGTATFTVLATFDDTAPTPDVTGFGAAECGIPHTLDGSTSFDVDGDTVDTFEWFEVADDLTKTSVGTGAVITPTFGLGTHHIEFLLTDARARRNRGLVTVEVDDTLPPQVSDAAIIGPDCLWPPNHDYVVLDIHRDITGIVTDACDPNPQLIIAGATSSQPDDARGDGSTINDVVVFPDHVCLRAERQGTEQEGRTYFIEVAGLDASGNQGEPTLEVRVAHDQRKENRCTFAGPIEVANEGDPRCTPSAPASSDGEEGAAAAATSDAAGCAAAPAAALLWPLLFLPTRRRRRC